MGDPVNKIRRDYKADKDSGPRKLSSIRYFVIHTAEAPLPQTGAEAVGSYFEKDHARGSTQYGVDVNSTQQYLGDDRIAWGAPPLNVSGLHVECAGRAAFDRVKWLDEYGPMFRRLGYLVASRCRKYGIPMEVLTIAQLRKAGTSPAKGHGGIVTHNSVSEVWKESTHWDPGKGFPMDVTMAWVEWYAQPVIKQKVSKPVLHLFCKGKWVERLQRDLKAHNAFSHEVTGVYNRVTEASVKTFQKANGIKATGVVDLRTWKALEK